MEYFLNFLHKSQVANISIKVQCTCTCTCTCKRIQSLRHLASPPSNWYLRLCCRQPPKRPDAQVASSSPFCLKQAPHLVHIHHIGHQRSRLLQGVPALHILHIRPQTLPVISYLFLLLSFTLHKSLFCWQLDTPARHLQDLLQDPSSVSPLLRRKRQADKRQDYSSWLSFPEEPIPSLHWNLDNGHYTTTILSFTQKSHLSDSETDLTCMHSYIVIDCKHCRLSSRYE